MKRELVLSLWPLLLAAGCGDPYARYADAVHDDVDAAMVAAFKMSARLNLTIAHNQIPFDSLDVVGRVVDAAATDAWKRAMRFADVTPPADMARSHADLRAELMRLAAALEALGSAFKRCADLKTKPSAAAACQAHLAALAPHFGSVGEDVRVARNRVQRDLQSHGGFLKPMD